MRYKGAVLLKAGREKKIRNGYPWVQREEVQGLDGPPASGAVVQVLDSKGKFLGVGTYNGGARFPVRVFTLLEEPLDVPFFEKRFRYASSRRAALAESTNSVREVFAEADGVPGLIVDRYGPHLVVQTRSLGTEALRTTWMEALERVYKPESILERSDMAGRLEENLEPFVRQWKGETPERFQVRELGLDMLALPKEGLKTGYYLDQRATRARLHATAKAGERILDAFCYTGACSLAGAKAGAKVLGLDILESAVEGARASAEHNGLEAKFEVANAFEWLEAYEGEPFDTILLDPPAIAKSAKGKDSLKWAIWKLVFHALPHSRPGGRLIVCSCSYQVGLQQLLETCRLACADRGMRLTLEHVGIQDLDHPTPLGFPEAAYLKCAWLRRSEI